MAAVTVKGQVLDGRGRPLAGARIGWASGPPRAALPDVMALSGADGRFVLSAPVAGDYVIACHTDEAGSTTLAVQVAGKAVKVTVRVGN